MYTISLPPGTVSSPEVEYENAILAENHINPGKSVTPDMAPNSIDGEPLVSAAHILGGFSVGKQLCRIDVEDAVEHFVDTFAHGLIDIL